MRIRVLCALVMLIAAGAEAGRAATPSEAADNALEAHRKGDRETIAALAASDTPDPWLIAEELLYRGEKDAARALATAADRPDLAALDGWLSKQEKYPVDPAARTAGGKADALLREKKAKEALEAIRDLSTVAVDPTSIRLVEVRGSALHLLGRRTECVPVFTRAAEMATEIGWLRRAAENYERAARIAREAGTPHIAVSNSRSRLAVEERRGNPAGRIAALTNLGRAYRALSEPDRAETELERAGKLATEEGDAAGRAGVELNLGHLALDRGQTDAALRHYGLCHELAEKAGDRSLVAGAMIGRARVGRANGELESALALHRKAAAIYEALGEKTRQATVLSDLGNLYRGRGDLREAASCLVRSRQLFEEVGEKAGLVMALTNLAALYASARQIGPAIEAYEAALAGARGIGDAYGRALILGNLGELLTRARQFDRAEDLLDESIAIRAGIGDRFGVGITLGNLGLVFAYTGRHEKALETFTKALRISSEYGPVEVAVRHAWSIAVANLQLGRFADAVAAARRAIGVLSGVYRREGGVRAAQARARERAIYPLGLHAAVLANDPAGAFYFLEAGRASALLEALEGKVTLDHTGVPKELREAMEEARTALANARKVFRGALDARRPVSIARTKKAYAAAKEAMLDTVRRVRRDARAVADVLYPEPRPLDEMKKLLSPGEAMVLYGPTLEFLVALVVTAKDARIVRFESIPDLDGLCTSVNFADPAEYLGESLPDLRKKLVDPLGLGDDIRRVLVSPIGALSYVPMAALLPDRAVSFIPSGTTWAFLRETPAAAGRQVLTLGGDATRSTLTANLGRHAGRWRVVHLAVPGRVDTVRPALSGLSLTPDDPDQGLLSMLDVYGMRIPADLVLLSRCAAARGPGAKAEGVVGFTRAFMMAGSTRVIVSLWEVDEAARREFLKEFFRLFAPRDGGEGLPAAEALRRAQEHIRSREEWAHPHHWAAWQLWGRG